MKLRDNDEIIGYLSDVVCKNGECILYFCHITKIIIPSDVLNKEFLKDFIGKNIGLLNLDGMYHIRILHKENDSN
jgi:hypothetical protein